MFSHLLILFCKHLLSTYYVSDTLLAIEKTSVFTVWWIFARFYAKGVYISLLRRPWQINTNWVSKPTEVILSQLWRLEIWDQRASRAPLLPKDPGRPPLSVSSFWCSQQSLAFLGLNLQWPWSLQSRSASSHGLLPSVCSNSPLLIRIPVTELWLTLIQCDLLCTWLHLPRPCFQTRLCSQIPGDMNLWRAFFSGSVQCPWTVLPDSHNCPLG